jgi:4-amino-4-deoxy-L-arabinose transferase-like glycosyltransferase
LYFSQDVVAEWYGTNSACGSFLHSNEVKHHNLFVSSSRPADEMRLTSKDVIRLLLLLVLATYVIFLRLGDRDIATSSEGQRSTVPIEMIRSGDYIIPTINYEPYLLKPPLIYWMVLLSYKITGAINPWTARLPAALSGVVLVIIFYFINKQFFDPEISLVSSLMLVTSPYMLLKMRQCEIDLALTLVLFLSVYFLYKCCYHREGKTYHFALLSGLFLGLASLLKGPVPLMFYLLAIASLSLIDKSNLKKFFGSNALLIIVVFIVVAVPWYLAVIKRIGLEHAWSIVRGEAVERLYRSTEINSGSLFFYIARVPIALAPWGLLLPLTLRSTYFKKAINSDFTRFTLLYLYFGIVVLSLIKGKETTYVLPLMPFAIVLVAFIFTEFLNGRLTRFQTTYIRYWFWGSLTASIIGGFYLIGKYVRASISSPNIFQVALSFVPIIVLTLLIIVYQREKKFLNSIVCLTGICALVFALNAGIEINKKNTSESLKLVGESARQILDRNYTLEIFQKTKPQLMFYLRRKVNVIHNIEDVKTRVDEHLPYFIIMENADFQKLQGMTHKDLYLYTKPVTKKGFAIVSNVNMKQP